MTHSLAVRAMTPSPAGLAVTLRCTAGVLQNFTFGGLDTISILDSTGAEGALDFISEVETLRFNGVNYAVISGTTGVNTLTGTAASDAIFGFAGNDLINGGGGNDILSVAAVQRHDHPGRERGP